MINMIKRLFKEEEGQGMVEYAIIIALIAVVVIGAVTALGTSISKKFEELSTQINGMTDAK